LLGFVVDFGDHWTRQRAREFEVPEMLALASFPQKEGQGYDVVDIKLRLIINAPYMDARTEFAYRCHPWI
jgi:hypothetical protein